MTAPFFVDTNILIYADDSSAPIKQSVSRRLIERALQERSGRISMQVLREFFAAATRKVGMDAAMARRRVELYARIDLVHLRVEDLLAAIDMHRLHSLSIWDALILRAAQTSNCAILYTEDLQAGFRLDGVQVVNPFADTQGVDDSGVRVVDR